MAVIEMLLGLRSPQGLEGEIVCYMDSGVVQGVVNGSTDTECIGELRDRFAKLRARDNLLGAVLARLGADPGARETEAHNAVVRLLNAQTALEKLAEGLGLKMDAPQVLVMQILAMNTELTSALAKANEGERVHVAALCQRAELAEAELKALTEENAKRKAELEALSASMSRREELVNSLDVRLNRAQDSAIEECTKRGAAEAYARDLAASLRSQMDDTRAAKAEAAEMRTKLAEADLERMLASARAEGLAAELQSLERALREKLRG